MADDSYDKMNDTTGIKIRRVAMVPLPALFSRITKGLRPTCIIACMTGLLLLSGCASFQITVPDSDPAKPRGHTEGYLKETMHVYFWGLLRNPKVISAKCDSAGINDVIVYRTLANDLAGVITLGIWMPTEVYFRCTTPLEKPPLPPSPSKRSRSRQLT